MLVCSLRKNPPSPSTSAFLLRRSTPAVRPVLPRFLSTESARTTTAKRSAPSPWLFFAIFTAGCSTFVYITHKRSLNDSDPRLRSKALPSFGGAPTVVPSDRPDASSTRPQA
ncbi:hypothetical protein PGT21_006813 [Puccinia graminis f. sp. tritici]|uniref:Uncharacterized protein n=1 Tax=Puccinia graminis f. sp. tritici TaxID=56615 RepID=A0A5B0RC15_PUCGR|nr:hypothetical protein PGT21_006813 [Puccinia graminis f. sp. tritici]KAA1123217.1 hypothetical protein PGTUg99_010108 [Puccinia graminis f. sp. tritici]